MVAGVDYAVGIDSRATLTPAISGGVIHPTLVAQGAAFGPDPNAIYFNTPGVTVGTDTLAWDFSINAGRWCMIPNASTQTFKNCFFKFGTGTPAGSGRSVVNPSGDTVTFLNCEADGNAYDNEGGMFIPGGTPGVHTWKHCYFHGAWNIYIQDGPPWNSGPSTTTIVENSVFHDGLTGFYSNGAHCDIVQFGQSNQGGTPLDYDDIEMNWNTVILDLPSINTQGYSLMTAANNVGFAKKIGASNNCFVLSGTPVNSLGGSNSGLWVSWPIQIETPKLRANAPVLVSNNYMFLGGDGVTPATLACPSYLFYGDLNGFGPPYGGILSQTPNNVEMRSGTTLSAFSG